MKTLLKFEEIALFLFGCGAFIHLRGSIELLPLLIFTPDASMVGYVFGPGIGAFTYNLVHNRATAVILFILGMGLAALGMSSPGRFVAHISCIFFAHTAMDRALGYGLKYSDAFKHTHLGWIGKK